jgi:hypothetical protein
LVSARRQWRTGGDVRAGNDRNAGTLAGMSGKDMRQAAMARKCKASVAHPARAITPGCKGISHECPDSGSCRVVFSEVLIAWDFSRV